MSTNIIFHYGNYFPKRRLRTLMVPSSPSKKHITLFRMGDPPETNRRVNISCINRYITDDKLNQDEILLVHTSNSIGCKYYGNSSKLVEKYPYCDIAGLRCVRGEFFLFAP